MLPPDQIKAIASGQRKQTRKLLDDLSGMKDREVDALFHDAHDAVFARTDCMTCANCCKTTGPLFNQQDIDRLAHHLGLRPGSFVESYLRVDEDGDLVLRSVPCPFLEEDNACGVYEIRPKACRTYPHTDRRRQSGILDLTATNAEICPAVFEILQVIRRNLDC
ncbi:MAG: YkgJ family cysteine cluster protein [Saprospiraceae bacterium]|nr:YkgJ family cysteine cluster protein [Saprospiraceae bacterium]